MGGLTVGHDRGPTRILVYGVTGSGKTTLARRIGEATGLPWHEADQLTWEPGWTEVPLDEQKRRIQSLCDGEEWVLDTAYGKWLEIPLERAQLIVGLDYPRWVSLGRLLKRTVTRARDGLPVCNGNRETWRQAFSRDSIVAWHFKSFAHKRARLRRWVAEGRPVLVFRSPRKTEQWLSGLNGGTAMSDDACSDYHRKSPL